MARLRSKPIRSLSRASFAALALAGLGAWPVLAQESGFEWSQFQGGPGHPGTIAEAPAPPYHQLWRFGPPEGGLSGAVIAGDVTIAVGEQAVYALDLRTGEVAWQIPRDGGPLSTPALGVAGEHQVLVYVDGPLEDDEDASPTPTPSASPSGTDGEKPYQPASELVAVDLADRSELWRTTLEDTSRSGIAIEGQRAYVADDKGGVYAIEIASGAVVWTAEAIGRVDSPPAVADGNVYVAARDVDGQQAQVLALDAETSERRWAFSPQAGAVAASAILAADGTVVVGAADRLVRGLSAQDGQVRWDALTLTLFSPVSAPVLEAEAVYIADASGGVYRVDAVDGSRAWEHQTNELIVRSSPVVAGGYVLVGLNDGRLAAFDPETGDLVFESEASQGLIGAISLSPEVLVAVKGGKEEGLVAFEHDPEGAFVRVPSPTVLDPARLLGAFAAAAAIAGAAILVPFRLLRSRIGPAFTRDEDLEGSDDADEEDAT
jgi:outer membrane protein assembly factor BamB